MTHTSGIPDHYNLGAYKKDLKNSEVLDLLVKQEKLEFNPGEKYSYSNGGYVLLAMIIEKVSGKPLHTFMHDNIFGPLGMRDFSGQEKSNAKKNQETFGRADHRDPPRSRDLRQADPGLCA